MSSSILVQIEGQEPISPKEEDKLSVKGLIINGNSESNSNATEKNEPASVVADEWKGKV